MVTNITLMKIAGYGGFIVASTGMYLQSKLKERIRNYDYYRSALKLLRSNQGAIYLLGEPIKDKSFKLTDSEKNFANETTARFEIPISGSKEKGTYWFWANNIDGEWVITRAELGLKNDPDRRLVIVKEKLENEEE